MPQKRFLLITAIGVLLAATIPYLIAYQSGGGQQFGGFLVNPMDGHSYLAKMQEGFRGEWKFTLPYTAEPGQGAYLFIFYLALGHLARIIQVPLLGVFHGARIAGGIVLIWAVSRLTKAIFSDDWDRKVAFLLMLIGSGLGWIAVLAGLFTSDFWVAEAFPFLSLYTNPHFSFGLALMILAVLPGERNAFLEKLLIGVGIAAIQPFGVVIVGLVLLIENLLWLIDERPSWGQLLRSNKTKRLLGFGIGGGPFLVYQFWAIQSDPVLAAWQAQNQTPTPNLIDLLFSFSPALILAVLGVWKAWRIPEAKKMVVWAGVSIILVFIPWSLQRRFLTGIYIPLAALCIIGISWLAEKTSSNRNFWASVVLVLSLPTNIIVVASGIQAAFLQDQQIYIDADSASALDWIKENTSADDLVIAEQDMGLLIPSITGRRVIYGHLFETISAEIEQSFISSFFYQDHLPQYYQTSLAERNADVVMLSDKASPSLRTWLDEHWILVFQSGEEKIFIKQAP